MDTIRSLLGILLRTAFGLILIFLVWWIVSMFLPEASLRNIFSSSATSTSDGGWLPAPGSLAGLLGKKNNSEQNGQVYVSGPAYNGYGNASGNNVSYSQYDYISYTADGTKIIHGDNTSASATTNNKTTNSQTSPYAQKELYIRNLSIYEGGHVYTGLSFVGEAKNTMFQDGRFTIVIADSTGKVVSTSYADATTAWSAPGWVRFEVKINSVLPNKVRCIMVFQSGAPARQNSNSSYSSYTYSNQQATPVRVAIPILCN